MHNARRALILLPASTPSGIKSAEWLEISYLLAVATRFAMSSAADVVNAVEALSEGVKQARGNKDCFGLARALSERASLLLTLLYRSILEFGSTSRLRELELEPYLQKFYDDLNEAHSALATKGDSGQDVGGHLLAIRTQLWSNIASARVLAQLLSDTPEGPYLPSPPKVLLSTAITFMNGRIGDQYLPVVLEAEWVMARYFEGLVSRSDAAEALPIIGEHGAFDLDILKLKRFRSMLSDPGVKSALSAEPVGA